mmetsp:Transcript_40448/g.106188  ORF Transcript_40448/g.106188 Transcript_40448/m.106188 type:complete len:249 (-) Transcript_40448:856-1602(-)
MPMRTDLRAYCMARMHSSGRSALKTSVGGPSSSKETMVRVCASRWERWSNCCPKPTNASSPARFVPANSRKNSRTVVRASKLSEAWRFSLNLCSMLVSTLSQIAVSGSPGHRSTTGRLRLVRRRFQNLLWWTCSTSCSESESCSEGRWEEGAGLRGTGLRRPLPNRCIRTLFVLPGIRGEPRGLLRALATDWYIVGNGDAWRLRGPDDAAMMVESSSRAMPAQMHSRHCEAAGKTSATLLPTNPSSLA